MIQKPLIIPLSDYLLYGHFHSWHYTKKGNPTVPFFSLQYHLHIGRTVFILQFIIFIACLSKFLKHTANDQFIRFLINDTVLDIAFPKLSVIHF
jgi:hypothetical protein